MKIEKRLCDICGNEIAKRHPTRIERHEYSKEQYRPSYKKVGIYDICDNCCSNLPELFKALKEDK